MIIGKTKEEVTKARNIVTSDSFSQVILKMFEG